MSLKDALTKAYAEKGKEVPFQSEPDKKRVVLMPGKKGQKNLVVVKYGPTQNRHVQRPNKVTADTSSLTPPEKSMVVGNAQTTKPTDIRKELPAITRVDAHKVTQPVTRTPPQVRVLKNAECLVSIKKSNVQVLLDLDEDLGRKVSIHQNQNAEVREMAIGLDFGTSSVKVVIGDLASDQSFAVPFLKTQGVDAYLLPSRVFEFATATTQASKGTFSLSETKLSHRDLKLGLLGSPNSLAARVEVAAFLALVIKRARAWFFGQYASNYKLIKCLWQVRIGLPAAKALVDDQYVVLFQKLVHAAWLAAEQQDQPNRKAMELLCECVFEGNEQADDLEVQVIPEIAAQIFGFVASNSFDNKAENRYLMVDVGAGTVDSSLFKVIPGRGGVWSFEFYTAVVQPHGVSNLHAYRVDWWSSKLANSDSAVQLVSDLRSTKFATDIGVNIPTSNSGYFRGVYLHGTDPNSADQDFFKLKLKAQVQGSTMWRAWKDGYLAQDQVSHIPMFLCGGGARAPLYRELETSLQKMHGFSWLSAEPWQLGFPKDLVLNHVNEEDFDRLSVAYGLSKLNVGAVTQALPPPKIPSDPQVPFRDRYVDKDQI